MARPTRMAGNFSDATKNLPLGKDPAHVRRRIEAMEQLLERAFTIPGTKQAVGLDVILDLIPGIGTTLGAGMGLYMAWEARNLGMSKAAIARMESNEQLGKIVVGDA